MSPAYSKEAGHASRWYSWASVFTECPEHGSSERDAENEQSRWILLLAWMLYCTAILSTLTGFAWKAQFSTGGQCAFLLGGRDHVYHLRRPGTPKKQEREVWVVTDTLLQQSSGSPETNTSCSSFTPPTRITCFHPWVQTDYCRGKLFGNMFCTGPQVYVIFH